jgi:hypothetical protein
MIDTLRKIKGKLLAPKLTVYDEYIDWLSFANAGMLDKGNLYCFDYAIKNLPSQKPIVEIGSFCGLSTNIISYFLAKYKKNNLIFSADAWIFEGSQKKVLGSSAITHAEYRQFVKESFMRNVKMFSRDYLPFTIEQVSDDFFASWKDKRKLKDVFGRDAQLGGPISFCYIDGNHEYDFAKRDFENADRSLEKGGFLFFDDSSDFSDFGCAQLMKEILKDKRYKLVIKNPNYLFQKIS